MQRSADLAKAHSGDPGRNWSPWRAVVGFGVWKKFGEKVKEKVGGSTDQVEELPTTTEE